MGFWVLVHDKLDIAHNSKEKAATFEPGGSILRVDGLAPMGRKMA